MITTTLLGHDRFDSILSCGLKMSLEPLVRQNNRVVGVDTEERLCHLLLVEKCLYIKLTMIERVRTIPFFSDPQIGKMC